MVFGRVRNLVTKGLEVLEKRAKQRTREGQTPPSVQLQRLLLEGGTIFYLISKIPEDQGGLDPKRGEEAKKECIRWFAGGLCAGPYTILGKVGEVSETLFCFCVPLPPSLPPSLPVFILIVRLPLAHSNCILLHYY